ncbi:YqhG family protein [Cytobacillus sp. IB215665]|uniref:YqhG family protein n=1 Tax=Cytobacillus sp. IB215665 TaxID=3097357 RepID=UPI002A105889|nr:YqhG family protein [Cytobacillus sp. IB215665]MDX8364260.1 YqhG family protein [Cytobacillus sp. IB215665]
MHQQEIHNFLYHFFSSNDCHVIENEHGYLTVQLSVDLDKELMNRPFYWHYLEKTGGTPNPMKLTLITDQSKASTTKKGEVVHFGSPRLHQIFASLQKLAGFIRLYEDNVTPTNHSSIPLYPWIGINVLISYECDRKRDYIHSLGLHMINGMIVTNFQNQLNKLRLTPKIPDLCFTMSPLIMPQSGLVRLNQHINHMIEQEDHSWADEARERWNEDLSLLNHFYEGVEEKPDCYETEKRALQEQYEPTINVKVINGGLFYLRQTSNIKKDA